MQALSLPLITLPQLKLALEASWDSRTAYCGALEAGNAALGQCYPTARVVQWFFPELEIASGEVDTGSALEAHFWNIDLTCNPAEHVDLTWQQFAAGSHVFRFKVLDRHQLKDSPPTVLRCNLLLDRVRLKLKNAADQRPDGMNARDRLD
ncbi:MAG TPA: hypothetical protein VGW38_09530 [Chloroflexota bacterium]|nr:hypothetical protein [Chloroflexota bacterium]